MIERAVDSVFLGGVSILFDIAVVVLKRVRRATKPEVVDYNLTTKNAMLVEQ